MICKCIPETHSQQDLKPHQWRLLGVQRHFRHTNRCGMVSTGAPHMHKNRCKHFNVRHTYTRNSLNNNMFGQIRGGAQGSFIIKRKNGIKDNKSHINHIADFGKYSRLIALSTTCLEM